METVFINAINTAINPVMIGFYLGGLVFCLGFVPAVAFRSISVPVEEI